MTVEPVARRRPDPSFVQDPMKRPVDRAEERIQVADWNNLAARQRRRLDHPSGPTASARRT
jgi:hypothetical protein